MNDKELGLLYLITDQYPLSSENYIEALNIFEKLIKTEPEYEMAWFGKAAILLQLCRYKESLKASEKIIEICEKYPEKLDKRAIFYSGAWVCKGFALSYLERDEESLEATIKAIETFDKCPSTPDENTSTIQSVAWANKGHVLSKLKRYEEALQAYDIAIEIKPNSIGAWTGKIGVYWGNHNYEKTLETIEKAMSVVEIENKINLLEMKGHVLSLNEMYREALEAYSDAIKINNENAHLWICKGILFLKLEAYSYALKSFEKAITIDPKDANAWKYKGLSLLDLGRDTECQEAFIQALYLDPKDAQMNTILAEYYLTFGDINNAFKYIENALLIDKDNAISLYIKGKIKIEEQDYVTSIRCFKKAISLELRDMTYLLWDSYAKYLMAELELASDEKKYQDTILGIIRELRKIECNYIEYNISQTISNWVFRITPYQVKKILIDMFEIIKRALIDLNISEENTVKILGIMHPIFVKFESTKNVAYNYYFLGCFYYKINDYFTAIDCLKQCKKLSSDREINNSASEILNNIWNNKIRPSFWKWWLHSPSNLWFKRISFIILSFFLFGILLPIQSIDIFKNSFFSSINWAENTVQLTLLTLTIIFILTSPNIQYFKSSQIEIEIRPPTEFELIPSLIEKKLNELEYEKPPQK